MPSTIKSAARVPTKLSKILAHLNASPKLNLTGVKGIRLSYAYRNDHWGARHFAKEQLPRIRWANPDLDIQVEKVLKTKKEGWRPELEVQFQNGQQQTFNLQGKWSTTIVKELMEVAGGPQWQKYKSQTLDSGKPLIPGEEYEPKDKPAVNTSLPSLATFRETKTTTANAPIPEIPSKPAQAQASLDA